MKFAIHHESNEYPDTIVIECSTIEELRDSAHRETTKRHWLDNDCWSEPLDEAAREFLREVK